MNKDSRRNHKLKAILLVSLLAVAALFFVPSIPQDPNYHQFADQRPSMGIPNFWNVVTNLPFLVVGLLGLLVAARGTFSENRPKLRTHYVIFFVGILFVGFGSAYYHVDPTNQTLVWDRLPITVALTAFFSAIIGEYISPRWGRRLLGPLLVFGMFSVFYWHATEVRGSGDLRPYVIVQFLPMLIIPLVLILLRSNFSGGGWFWAAIGAYALSRLAELQDGAVFGLTGVLSGHSLKHLLAALGAFFVIGALKRGRTTLPQSETRHLTSRT